MKLGTNLKSKQQQQNSRLARSRQFADPIPHRAIAVLPVRITPSGNHRRRPVPPTRPLACYCREAQGQQLRR